MANTGWKYARTVNEQINPNKPKRNRWSNISNAIGNSSNYASAKFTVKTSKNKKGNKIKTYNFPYTLTAHDFGLEIPSNAYISKVEVQARMKASKKNTSVEFPRGLMCIYGGGWSKHIDNTKKKETGWRNGLYFINPKKNLSNKFVTYSYTVSGDNIKKAKYEASDLNAPVCGIDLVFDDEDFKEDTVIYLQWVRIRVTYEIPTYKLTHSGTNTTEAQPLQITTGETNTLKYTLQQTTNADGGEQCLKLDVPFGTKLMTTPTVSRGSFNSSTNVWTVNCGANTTSTLTIQYADYTVNTQAITLSHIDCTGSTSPYPDEKKFYYQSGYGNVDDYGDVTTQLITPHPHKWHDLCFAVSSKVQSSSDTSITFDIEPQTGFQYENISYELDVNLSSQGVSISSYTDSSVTFTIPTTSDEDEEIDVCFRYCLRPLVTGEYYIETTVDGGSTSNQCPFTVLDPYEYHIGNQLESSEEEPYTFNIKLNNETVGFIGHRITTQVETGAYVLPCTVKDSDCLMTQSKPSLHMYKWKELDYIGCVPIEHHHFDPKSTYKDTLIDSRYKNKRYMGKKLASDEDITLNIRLHPQQVTTIQGLIDMDKPIPINANHKSFEGDSLNHRGWAEIYSIKSELTNPNWYKCEIDVKYLTHNLNTRFKINKGDKSDWCDGQLPNLLLETVASGEALSSFGQDVEEEVVSNYSDYFLVDTDGGYVYSAESTSVTNYLDENGKIVFYVDEGSQALIDEIEEEYGASNVSIIEGSTDEDYQNLIDSILEEGYTIISADIGEPIKVDDSIYTNENQRNIFTLDGGQHFDIKTKEALSDVSQVSLDWSTSMLTQAKQNNVSKIIKLVDTKNNITMFEYEYSDFDYSNYSDTDASVGEGQVECHIIGRAYRKGDYDEVINEDVLIPTTVLDEDDEESDNEVFFGSTVSFRLNNNKLSVVDTGTTGNALMRENILLEGTTYRYEVEWRNNNENLEDNDVSVFIDAVVQDSILASQYASKYGNMIVSPFPVAGKKQVFTRIGEEGVLYYYDDDSEEFSFLVEPYYIYHNGVDLRTSDGISIFNLNYGYKTVYLENGLVSLGINRLNGHMYLRKWDDDAKEYVTLFTLQLTEYDDVNINSITDDKIELQASNTIISMYRGHPYVILKHPLENIGIYDNFNKVWAESVGDDAQEYPTYFDLLNTSNLLPSCVGGTKEIDNDCVEVFECGDGVDCPDLQDTAIILNPPEITEGESVSIPYTSTNLSNGDLIYFIIDGDVQETPVTYPNSFVHTFEESKEYELSAVYVGDRRRSYAVAPTVTIFAKQEEIDVDPSAGCQPTTGKYKLKITSPSTFKYRDNQKVTVQLTRGGKPVCQKTVERIAFNHIYSGDTNRNGILTFSNKDTDTVPDTYKIGAKFYEGGSLITSAFKTVTVKKADTKWLCVQKAQTVGGTVKFELRNKDTDLTLKNKKVTVYINGKAYTKKTDENGRVAWKINKKGNKTYECSYGGSTRYKKSTKTFKEKVTNG